MVSGISAIVLIEPPGVEQRLSRHHLGFELFQQRLGCHCRGRWILTCNEMPIHDAERFPVANLFENRPETQQLIFNEEGHDVRELDVFFLAVGETGDTLAFNQGRAFVSDVAENPGSVAYEGYEFAGAVEGLNERDRSGLSARSHIGPCPPG